MKKNVLVDNLNHIIQVIQERIALYNKRQLEIKRSVKTLSRIGTIPSNRVLFLMLDAHINSIVNKIGKQALEEFLISNNTNDLNINSLFTYNSIVFNHFKKILKKSDLPLRDSTEQILSFLFDVVFGYSENIRRNKIMLYLKHYHSNLIETIFKQMVILDENYIKETIIQFDMYCKDYKEDHLI
ncbi:MAG: hypothetical protein FK733_13335 [Asgard group archaeon]|nr:hypothetical protein [Asgard group archaeon]